MLSVARTIVARTTEQVLSKVQPLLKAHKDHTLLFTLSTTALSQLPDLSILVNSLHAELPQSVGCLSAPLIASMEEKTLNYDDMLVSCSIALFEPGCATAFRSAIPGKATVQVGRWHAFRDLHNSRDANSVDSSIMHDQEIRQITAGLEGCNSFDWDSLWKRNNAVYELPSRLGSLNPNSIHSVLYLSDTAPEGLSKALSSSLPGCNHLGLIASSTPFITGHPVTLFHNGEILSSGAVGLALHGIIPRPTMRVQHPGWVPLSGTYNVTGSEGNLITGLNGQSPTKLLLEALRWDGEWLTETGSVKNTEQIGIAITTDSCVDIILGGDPARGPIALAADAAPGVGSEIQFLHRPRGPADELPTLDPNHQPTSTPLSVHFLKSLEGFPALESSEASLGKMGFTRGANGEEYDLTHAFVAASENGWLIAKDMGSDPWKCLAQGGVSSLSFPLVA